MSNHSIWRWLICSTTSSISSTTLSGSTRYQLDFLHMYHFVGFFHVLQIVNHFSVVASHLRGGTVQDFEKQGGGDDQRPRQPCGWPPGWIRVEQMGTWYRCWGGGGGPTGGKDFEDFRNSSLFSSVERSESRERDEETFRVKPVTKVFFQPKKRFCSG